MGLLRRLRLTKDQIEARTTPGTVEVYGEQVALPSRFERDAYGPGLTLDDAVVTNAGEHEAGRHGKNCDGRCAEQTYARWSAAGWS